MAHSPFFAPTLYATQEFTIRSYEPGDGAALNAATLDSYEHLRPWMPWATTEQTVDEAEELCRRFAANYLLNQDYVLGIWIGDELAGGTGFHLRHGGLNQRTVEIGMWIRAQHAGSGLGTRALAAMLRWGFEEWGWERIVWYCDTRNLASARVATKNGLKLEGTLRSDRLDVEGTRRDTHLFAILRREWEARG